MPQVICRKLFPERLLTTMLHVFSWIRPVQGYGSGYKVTPEITTTYKDSGSAQIYSPLPRNLMRRRSTTAELQLGSHRAGIGGRHIRSLLRVRARMASI